MSIVGSLTLALAWLAGAAADTAAPAFAVRVGDDFRVFGANSPGESGYSNHEDLLDATVAALGAGRWELTLTNKDRIIRELWFPWEPKPTSLGAIEDDVVYYPRFMGVAADAEALKDWDWWGKRYPGEAFAPLVVVADKTQGRMTAAINWPPKVVTPLFSRGRLALRYDQPIKPHQTQTYRVLLATATADENKGECPWRKLLDQYKVWLKERMRAAGLYPIEYPEKMRDANGWMNVQLECLPRFDINDLRRIYDSRRDVFPWIQFWGQMSNYQRDVAEGRTAYPDPPLAPGEKTGCCIEEPRLHHRYVPALPEFAEEVKAAGGLVGYYQRPPRPYDPLDAPGSASLHFLTNWIAQNAKDGANAFYLDVVGAVYFGEPLDVARLLRDQLPRMSVLERTADVYPSAALISGSLWGWLKWSTKPGQTPEQFGPELRRVTFPRFGRYLLDDRIIFLGACNGDFMWWGDYRNYGHWTERQAFLLGAKFDAPTTFKGQRGWIDPVNPVVDQIVGEWRRTRWWKRQPTYRDRDGVYNVSPGIDVRRFVDKDGVTLFAVENWKRKRGLFFTYRGRKVFAPEKRLCIMIMPPDCEPPP